MYYALVEGLLSWAQIQTGKIEYRLEKTDLFNLAEEVTRTTGNFCKNKSITLEQNIGENTFAICRRKICINCFQKPDFQCHKIHQTRRDVLKLKLLKRKIILKFLLKITELEYLRKP
jgi:hypothetical protein